LTNNAGLTPVRDRRSREVVMSYLATLILQIGIVLLVAAVIRQICKRIHQPPVIGEMLAGILLGPSLLGWVAPGFAAALFPPGSVAVLNALSQVGLLVFMFVVGLELNPNVLQGRGQRALVISYSGIAIPAILGGLLAFYFYPRLSASHVRFEHFALFLAISMSITAFPVLARILTDHRLLRTEVGSMAIACAAFEDVTAWCLLAIVVALVRSGYSSAMPFWVTIVGSLAYVAVAILLLKPALARMVRWCQRRSVTSKEIVLASLLAAFGSALITEWLGIHALFGAFLIGALMPREREFVRMLTNRLEGITLLLLPLFFAATGLKTSIALVSGADMWFYCALAIAVAIVGKFGGAATAARASGMGWRESGALGILMNTRGLMELIVLNIGLEIGVISPVLFTMLVIMALVTTFMAGPLLDVIYPKRIRDQERAAVAASEVAA
jgi:Kef-type K+ transport system membrane component KefB